MCSAILLILFYVVWYKSTITPPMIIFSQIGLSSALIGNRVDQFHSNICARSQGNRWYSDINTNPHGIFVAFIALEGYLLVLPSSVELIDYSIWN